MSTVPLSPRIVVSCSKAAVGSSDLHFKIQLESSQFKAFQQHKKSQFGHLKKKGHEPCQAVPVFSREGSEEGIELGHGGGVFVPIISRGESVLSPSVTVPTLPHHTTSSAMLRAAGGPPSAKEAAETTDNRLPLPYTHTP